MPLTDLQKEIIVDRITNRLLDFYRTETPESNLLPSVTPDLNNIRQPDTALTPDYNLSPLLQSTMFSSDSLSKTDILEPNQQTPFSLMPFDTKQTDYNLSLLPQSTVFSSALLNENISSENDDAISTDEDAVSQDNMEEEGDEIEIEEETEQTEVETEKTEETETEETEENITSSLETDTVFQENTKYSPLTSSKTPTVHNIEEENTNFAQPVPTFPAFQTTQYNPKVNTVQPSSLSTLSANADVFREPISTEKKLSEIQKDKNQTAIAQAEEEKRKNGSNFLVTGADWVQRNIFDRIAGWMPLGFLKSAIQMIGNTLTGLFKTIGHLFDGKVGDALSSGWSWLKDAALIGGSVAGVMVVRKQIKKLNKDVNTLTTTNNTVQNSSDASASSQSDVPLAQENSFGGLKTLNGQMPLSNVTESEIDAVTLAQKANQRNIG